MALLEWAKPVGERSNTKPRRYRPSAQAMQFAFVEIGQAETGAELIVMPAKLGAFSVLMIDGQFFGTFERRKKFYIKRD